MSSNQFSVHVGNKSLYWDPLTVEKKLKNLTSTDRKTTWIREDLSTVKSGILGRAFWIFARHISLFRKAFYKIDLKQSEKILQELKQQIESQHASMIPLFNQSIDHFNAQFPKHRLAKLSEERRSHVAQEDELLVPKEPSIPIVPQLEIPEIPLEHLTVPLKPETIPEPVTTIQRKELSQENQDWVRENFLEGRSASQPGGIPVLTDDEITALKDKWEKGPFPIVTPFGSLDTEALNSLKNTKWLDSEAINTFLRRFETPKVGIFLTNFYSYLFPGDKIIENQDLVKEVSTWGFVETMFDKDKIIIPINQGVRIIQPGIQPGTWWSLIALDITNKRIVQHHDSHGIRKGNQDLLNRLRDWVVDEATRQGKDEFATGWTTLEVTVPLQGNGWDCGVFLCRFGERIAQGKYLPDGSYDFDFQVQNAPYYRLYIAHRLLSQK